MRDYLETLDSKKPMAAARIVRRDRYAWPGGYALALIFRDGELACADCVARNFHEISQATRANYRDEWQAVGMTHAGEADVEEMCACCNSAIFGFED